VVVKGVELSTKLGNDTRNVEFDRKPSLVSTELRAMG
jgi:hypothetical protein